MASAYLHVRDMMEQARTILANDVWFDEEVDRLLEKAMKRLAILDSRSSGSVLAPLRPASSHRLREGIMPWLDPDRH